MSLLDCICCSKHKLHTAVIWDTHTDVIVCSLTYSELISNAYEISTYLQQNVKYPAENHIGLKSNPICIYGSNCPEVLSALLGIMALPGSFMPIDLAQPSAQKEHLLRKCGVGLVIVQLSLLQDFLTQAETWSTSHVSLDSGLVENGFIICSISWPQLNSPVKVPSESDKTHDESALLEMYYENIKTHCRLCDCNESGHNPEVHGQELVPYNGWGFPNILSTEIAYSLHTSGTTGLSKLVLVPHCCIVPNIIDLRERFQLNYDDVIFNAAPLTFDPSIVEMFLALSSGAALLIVPDKIKRSPSVLASVLFKRQHTTVLQVTPTLVNRFSDQKIKSDILGSDSRIRVLALGGENCPSLGTIAKWKSPENRTSVFNVYGITEVSSWATCYQIPSNDIDTSSSDDDSLPPVPLGESLLGTKVRVHDETGYEGYGQIWIGGDYRVCILEGEAHVTPGLMRPSGDYGYFGKDGRLYYQGRCDRQIKRLGHRINLDSIEKVIGTLDGITSCVVTTSSDSPTTHTTPWPAQSQPSGNYALLAFVVPSSCLNISTMTIKLLLSQMRRVLPTYSIPDEIKLVKYLPMTSHGKIDVKSLVSHTIPDIYLSPSNPATQHQQILSDIILILKSAATVVLGVHSWASHERLIDLGANSFDIVRVANLIESEIRNVSSCRSNELELLNLVEYLFTESRDGVVAYIRTEMKQVVGTMSDVGSLNKEVMIEVKKRLPTESLSTITVAPKRIHLESLDIRSWRKGQFFCNSLLQINSFSLNSPFFSNYTPSCSFEVKWKVDTGKCVDASPLVVQHSNGSTERQQTALVYIGSHSGWFFAIDCSSGTVLWKTLLNDRIESSACTSLCGQYIIVGTYSGSLYTLVVSSGAIHWCLVLPGPCDPIKSSPVADPNTGLIWFGSHEQYLYGVDILEKQIVHKVYLGGGSCFSSPCIDSNCRTIYSATLQGRVSAVHLDIGSVIWTFQCPKPVFSSPTLLSEDGTIVVGCVDGAVYVITSSGHLKTKLATTQSVFSSCCIARCPILKDNSVDGTNPQSNKKHSESSQSNNFNETGKPQQPYIFCGSHDKHIYCWNGDTLELEWKTNLEAEVYSTPFVVLYKQL